MSQPYLPAAPLVDAILAMVRAGVPATCKVYEGRSVPGAVPPYAVFYFDSGGKSAFERNVLNEAPRDLRYQVTAVGSTPEQARWVADKVFVPLLTSVPSVSGRQVWPAIEEGSQPVRPDDEATGFFLATSQYLTRSEAT
ncbi:hypothetical protein ACBJ59_36545 [Nonomuraea sp. MTCD27]|uniref:hypothetical protein n=1 Tax=Nonomuraea sp. MTCD27 TaxID=1676747 RepID=UPI0035C199D0